MAALNIYMEAWGEVKKDRRSVLLSLALHMPSTGTEPTLLSSLLNSSSSCSKSAPSCPQESLRSVAASQTGVQVCYQLFGSEVFNNVKGGSTASWAVSYYRERCEYVQPLLFSFNYPVLSYFSIYASTPLLKQLFLPRCLRLLHQAVAPA